MAAAAAPRPSSPPLRTSIALLLLALALSALVPSSDAYDSLDPVGNITIKWDVKKWREDGYMATVSLYNYQQYRHIQAPGWKLGWVWAGKEIIWKMAGAQTTEQGDCSRFREEPPPHCCRTDPEVVDFLPGASYDKQTPNCCKGGVLSSWGQDPANAIATFDVNVGRAGTTNSSVQVPTNFTLKAPGPGYTCGPAKEVEPTKFIDKDGDGRRTTQAIKTWNVTCTYSQFVAGRSPTCCVVLSSFYNSSIVECNKCSCGCQDNSTNPVSCIRPNSPYLSSVVPGDSTNTPAPLVKCSSHMCPIRVQWHVKANYKDYWRVKITVQSFNYLMNYSQWNLVAQHPNFNNLTTIFSFRYKDLNPYGTINDTGMMWGIKYYNDLLMTAQHNGNVQSELLFRKDPETFTFQKGWAFPRRVYFNGENCVMPPPDAYPWLPNDSHRLSASLTIPFITVWTALAFLLVHV
ncbi:COBRA-like protein 1 [Triticum dicoccoides]|uniref:COBRA-like protein 1 n=1 Tax=Triticum dicoccoides TaxID=85692 RepID=UPI000E7A905D|nr:COBRA-like protein 1 [Triticum dicoccoides]